MEKIKFLEHTADIKFQVVGNTLEELFKNSAIAMKKSMFKDLKIKSKKEKEIKINGKDFESLLYNFLEEFLYLLDAEDFILSKIKKIKIKKFELKAIISGDNSRDYNFVNDIKAITYNNMFIKQNKTGWIAQVVLDA